MIQFRSGAYTVHKHKLLKLENGYFLLYYHRQNVSNKILALIQSLVVHAAFAIFALYGALVGARLLDPQKSILQDLPNYAAYHDGRLGRVSDSNR